MIILVHVRYMEIYYFILGANRMLTLFYVPDLFVIYSYKHVYLLCCYVQYPAGFLSIMDLWNV